MTIVSYGRMLERVLQAADEVAADGISVEVVDPRTLIPLDKELIINSVKRLGSSCWLMTLTRQVVLLGK